MNNKYWEIYFLAKRSCRRKEVALMNLFLHNIGDIDSDNSICPADALIAPSGVYYDLSCC
jgi:hypothetical protein